MISEDQLGNKTWLVLLKTWADCAQWRESFHQQYDGKVDYLVNRRDLIKTFNNSRIMFLSYTEPYWQCRVKGYKFDGVITDIQNEEVQEALPGVTLYKL